MRRLAVLLACFVLTSATGSSAPANNANELRTAKAFDSYKSRGPAALYSFLVEFPKGADLHVHLSGAVYAETFIRDAAEGLGFLGAAVQFRRALVIAPAGLTRQKAGFVVQ